MGRKLNEGTYGVVHQATFKPTKEIRAVKVLQKQSVSSDRGQIQEFLAEFDLLKSLSHPNIVRVFEIYEDRQHFYIVTEL
jgi:calcium-dependent protein kinase